jgi:hypothetical protein
MKKSRANRPLFFVYAPPLKGKRPSNRRAVEPPYQGAPAWKCSVYYYWWEYLRRHEDTGKPVRARAGANMQISTLTLVMSIKVNFGVGGLNMQNYLQSHQLDMCLLNTVFRQIKTRSPCLFHWRTNYLSQ